MTTSPSNPKRVLPFPELAALRWPLPLSVSGWTSVDSAIAWIGFGNALPVSWWDTELAFGLSFWPWRGPYNVWSELEQRKEGLDYEWLLEGPRIGDRSEQLSNALLQFHRRRHKDPRIGERRSYETHASRRARRDADTAEFDAEVARRDMSPLDLLREEAEYVATFLYAAMRDEAARCHAAWGDIKQGVEAAFRQATLAADALLAALARGEITAYGVPAAHGGGAGADAAGRVAIPASVFAGPVTLAPDGLHLFLPHDCLSVEEHRPAFVKVVLPAGDVKRLFPREPGEWPDFAAEAPRRPGTAGEADGPAAEQRRNPGLVQGTGSPGRPSKSKDLYTSEHRQRLTSGEALADVADEATYLRDEWLPTAWPGAAVPSLKTIRNVITAEHRRHFGQPRLKDQPRRPK